MKLAKLKALPPKRLYWNLRGLATGKDLASQVRALTRRTEQLDILRAQGEFIAESAIAQFYDAARLPPPELRMHVGMNDEPLNFWAKGVASSRLVEEVFGTTPSGPVLDWGCGSGRTLLWLMRHPGWRPAYHGCDIDETAIEWLRSQGQTNVKVCTEEPPLPWDDGTFHGVFAFSVLTHIPGPKQRAWYEDLHRILAPGTAALFTLKGREGARRIGIIDALESDHETSLATAGDDPFVRYRRYASYVTDDFTRTALDGLFEIERYEEDGWFDQVAVVARRI
jgi:SAM-dependent methyltransferase